MTEPRTVRRAATWERHPRVAAPPPPPVGQDPREREAWFLRLDADARDVVRARWVQREAVEDGIGHDLRRVRREWLRTGATAFVAVQLLVHIGLRTLAMGAGGFGTLLTQLVFAGLFGTLAAALVDRLQLEQLGTAVVFSLVGSALVATEALFGVGAATVLFLQGFLLGCTGSLLGALRSGPAGA